MSEIVLNKIIPHPIRETFSPNSDVWGKDLSFQSGTHYHVCAPSGTGKTTLSHILYGLRHDYDGTLLNNGKVAKDWKPDDWSVYRQQTISIIYQDLKLLEEYTEAKDIEAKYKLKSDVMGKELEAEVTKSEESDEAKSMVNVEKLVSDEKNTSQ